jgi:hypothetical protein
MCRWSPCAIAVTGRLSGSDRSRIRRLPASSKPSRSAASGERLDGEGHRRVLLDQEVGATAEVLVAPPNPGLDRPRVDHERAAGVALLIDVQLTGEALEDAVDRQHEQGPRAEAHLARVGIDSPVPGRQSFGEQLVLMPSGLRRV